MNLQAFAPAANRLELRANTARQILEELGYGDMTIPMQSFNDDDWYEYSPLTKEMVKQYICKSPKPTARPGFAIARGMSAKHLGLWSVQP